MARFMRAMTVWTGALILTGIIPMKVVSIESFSKRP